MNRWQPLLQLFLARLREFYREPEVVFWVYGFPVLLAVGLGIAFSGREPAPPTVDVAEVPSLATQANAILQCLQADRRVDIELFGVRTAGDAGMRDAAAGSGARPASFTGSR